MRGIAGEGRIACNQVLYHLQERAIEHAVIPWCKQHDVAVVAYSPFGHNDFPSSRSKAGEVLQAIADAHGASPRQVALSFLTRDPQLFRDSKSLERGARRRQRRGRRARARQRRNRSARQGLSARTETAKPADAVADTVLNKMFRRRQLSCRAGCGEPPRAIAHIGFLFSGLVDDGQLSFFGRSPDSIISAPEFDLDPATRRSRQAG